MHKKSLIFLFSCLLLPTLSGGPALAAGPNGIGDLKLGMTQAQLQSLKGSVELSSSLTEWQPPEQHKPRPGEIKLEGILKNPISGSSKSVFTFTNGKLSEIYMGLGSEAEFKNAKNLIVSKYGKPEEQNDQAEKQCIYKNGSNFKIKNGIVVYSWVQPQAGKMVGTRLTEIIMDSCPSNLRYGSIGDITVRSLTIGLREKSSQPANPF